VQNAFQRLYDNVDGIQDSFAMMWNHVVSKLMNEPNIIAYEIMNEPWVGNTYDDPQRIVEGDNTNLAVL
jgi:endoglycosylceramidase